MEEQPYQCFVEREKSDYTKAMREIADKARAEGRNPLEAIAEAWDFGELPSERFFDAQNLK